MTADADKVEPALTPAEWALRLDGEYSGDQRRSGIPVVHPEGGGHWDVGLAVSYDSGWVTQTVPVEELPVLIALANAVLPDSDPRKITRAKLEAMRYAASALAGEWEEGDIVYALADALESYLPPE